MVKQACEPSSWENQVLFSYIASLKSAWATRVKNRNKTPQKQTNQNKKAKQEQKNIH